MNRIGGIVVSHGQLANELLSAAEMVVGPLEHIRPYRSAGTMMSKWQRTRSLEGDRSDGSGAGV